MRGSERGRGKGREGEGRQESGREGERERENLSHVGSELSGGTYM